MKKTKKQQTQEKITFLENLGLQYAKDLDKNKTKWEITLYNILDNRPVCSHYSTINYFN